MLTQHEVNAIFDWQPYRSDWPVDRNIIHDNIEQYYGELIRALTTDPSFETYYSEDGNMGNYLEFFCYPPVDGRYDGNAVIVTVSLCAPVGAYGQSSFFKDQKTIAWGGLFPPEKINEISDGSLKAIEHRIKELLNKHQVTLLDKDFVCQPLPDEIAEALRYENHNTGSQFLHGIFQKTD